MSSTKLAENVPRADITHPKPTTIQNGIDVSANVRSWKSYLWDTFDKSPAERRLLFKIDATLVTFGCLGTFIKFLDRANLNTASVWKSTQLCQYFLQHCFDHRSSTSQSALDPNESEIFYTISRDWMDHMYFWTVTDEHTCTAIRLASTSCNIRNRPLFSNYVPLWFLVSEGRIGQAHGNCQYGCSSWPYVFRIPSSRCLFRAQRGSRTGRLALVIPNRRGHISRHHNSTVISTSRSTVTFEAKLHVFSRGN